jgi:glycogen debranching enzyme
VRDEGYHNGTVWPFLIGAGRRTRARPSTATRDHARRVPLPLVHHLVADGCIGQVSEISTATCRTVRGASRGVERGRAGARVDRRGP